MKKYVILALITIIFSMSAGAQLIYDKPGVWSSSLGIMMGDSIRPGIGYDLIKDFEPRFYLGSWKMRNDFRPGKLYPSLVMYPLKFEGTLEYKNGFSYLRTQDKLITLLLPKISSASDTPRGEGVKAEVWGYFLASPLYQLHVDHMNIDGKATFEKTLMSPFDRFPLF